MAEPDFQGGHRLQRKRIRQYGSGEKGPEAAGPRGLFRHGDIGARGIREHHLF